MADVTQILSQIEAGHPSAADQLLPLVYGELRKLSDAMVMVPMLYALFYRISAPSTQGHRSGLTANSAEQQQ
jgi:hypothetical protein